MRMVLFALGLACLVSCKPDGWTKDWYVSKVNQWSQSLTGSDPTGFRCEWYNSTWVECDVSIQGKIYPLECHYRGGCLTKLEKR